MDVEGGAAAPLVPLGGLGRLGGDQGGELAGLDPDIQAQRRVLEGRRIEAEVERVGRSTGWAAGGIILLRNGWTWAVAGHPEEFDADDRDDLEGVARLADLKLTTERVDDGEVSGT